MTEEHNPVYRDTVVPDTDKGGPMCVWWKHLLLPRFVLKVLEVVLSFVAFLCEELVEHCSNCGGLYFFEFMSCTAFLLSFVVIIVYSTKTAEKVLLPRLRIGDSCFTLLVGVFFLLASIVFVAGFYGTALESTSAAFGLLASIVFLMDFGLLWKKESVLLWKKGNNQREDKTNQRAAPEENRPLNIVQA